MTRAASWALLLILIGTKAHAEVNVPRFLAGRVPQGDSAAVPPDRWSASDNILWKVDIPGLAWSSPIVWGNRVIVTTCVNTGKTTEPRKGLYLEDVDANKYPKPKDKHEWRVACFDLNTGRPLWQRLAHAAVPAKPHHIKNTLASETPTSDGERIYAYFGNVGVFCYDMEGEPLWQKLLPPAETNYGWGTSSSPIVHEDRLYIVNDNEEKSYVLVLDKKSGEELLRIDREEKTNYATPFIWQNAERTELVTSGIGFARSYDLQGKPLWQIKGKSILAIPTPFEKFGNLYLAAGHVLWGENPLYVIRPGASGDISPKDGATTNDYIIWSHQKIGPYHPTPIVVDETLYVLYDRGMMAAFNAKTGEPVYSRKRIPNGRAFHQLSLVLRRQAVLHERGRRDVRDQGRARVRDPAHQSAGRGRHGHGHAAGGGRQAVDPHGAAAVLRGGQDGDGLAQVAREHASVLLAPPGDFFTRGPRSLTGG
jgi:outer membrane protein assembly factor BamB